MEKITLDQVDEILGEDKNLRLCRIQDHEGIIDSDGNIIVPFIYSTINGCVWSDGLLGVANDDGLIGFVNEKGEEVIECQFVFEVLGDDFRFCEGRFPIITQNGLIGFIDTKGKIVIDGYFYNIKHFSNGLCPVMNQYNKWGYIDRDGNLMIDYLYNKAYCFNENGTAQVLATVKKLYFFTEEKLVNIDKEGNIVS